ncbi:MAG: hypothetical protein V4724_21055 [Pseudomonadota bacterium]
MAHAQCGKIFRKQIMARDSISKVRIPASHFTAHCRMQAWSSGAVFRVRVHALLKINGIRHRRAGRGIVEDAPRAMAPPFKMQ